MNPLNSVLESIDKALSELNRPTGRGEYTNPPFGNMTVDTMLPSELIGDVSDGLIGASFVLAQVYLSRRPFAQLSDVQKKICDVANYFKHRDQWESEEDGQGKKTWKLDDRNGKTLAAIRALGVEGPDESDGSGERQMAKLAQKVLDAPFRIALLWSAIQ